MTRTERLVLAREGIAQSALSRDNLLIAVMIGLGLAGKRPLACIHLISETAKEGSGFQTLLGTVYALAADTVAYVAQPSEEAKRSHAFGIPRATWEALETHIFPHLSHDRA
jgi:hypothetical protein